MDKNILLLKYLDGELTEKEREQVEKLLENDVEAKSILEELRKKKQEIIEQLNHLNPDTLVELPELKEKRIIGISRGKTIKNVLRWAAILILALSLYFLAREIPNYRNSRLSEQHSSESNLSEEIIQYEDLSTTITDKDYAVSPNRSWSKKELVITINNTKIL